MSSEPAPATPGDQASVTVTVAVPIDAAFRIFTEEIELWWRRGPRFRNAPGESGIICLEPRVGGRVFESFKTEGTETVVEIGKIIVWEPPARLMFEWRASNFMADEKTEVEVRFQPAGAASASTRVTVVHRGWSQIRDDHPVRHGLASREYVRMMGLWWGDLLSELRVYALAVNRAAR
jgi:uncharacterized protein YndB with AHSA1/START domain